MIDCAVATQTNGVAEVLYASMNAWILCTRSVTLWNEPRLIARWLSNPNHRSTWFNQDAEVGVKCRWKRGSRRQPPLDLGVLVRRVVVQDQVDVQLRRHLPVDQAQERQELLVAVPLPAQSEHLSGGDVQGGEQRRRAVPDVVVGVAFGVAEAHRQRRLGAVERLNLRLFVHAQDHRVVGRVEVQADDVAHLLDENGSADSLKVCARCGLTPKRASQRCTVLLERASACPRVRVLQCVAASGGPCNARLITAATLSSS